MSIKILQGSCLETLSSLEEKSVNTCVTSPPYWGLRDYGTGEWVGGDPDCNHVKSENKHGGQRSDRDQEGYKKLYNYKCLQCGAVRKDDQLGLEETPEKFVENLVNVFREVRRVLRDDGTVWLNLGDSYSSGGRKTTTNQSLRGDNEYGVTRPKPSDGIKEKDLVGIPWRVAFALQADGWYLRQDIIWHKPNPMPESVQDRCTKAHEYIFLLSKSPKYYYDNEAIKEEIQDESAKRLLRGVSDNHKNSFGAPGQTPHTMNKPRKNVRKQFTSDMGGSGKSFKNHSGYKKEDGTLMIGEKRNKRSVWTVTTKPYSEAHFATYPPELIKPCILAGCPEGGTVLDPFGGSGTTAQVSNNLNRNAILCELNPEYVEIAKGRLHESLGMFLDLTVEIPLTKENQ